MKRIRRAYNSAIESMDKQKARVHLTKKDLRYGLVLMLILLVVGYNIDNYFGTFLIILGLFLSPLPIWISGFWMFVICLIVPEKYTKNTD